LHDDTELLDFAGRRVLKAFPEKVDTAFPKGNATTSKLERFPLTAGEISWLNSAH